ncbi:hypothetical protein CR513_01780, partial [Mucuna pruriens]
TEIVHLCCVCPHLAETSRISLCQDHIGHVPAESDSRPQVTTLRVSKDLKKLPMEELLGTLKVHEIELNKDEGKQKGKSIAFKARKT